MLLQCFFYGFCCMVSKSTILFFFLWEECGNEIQEEDGIWRRQ
jgi:hypothetical protein